MAKKKTQGEIVGIYSNRRAAPNKSKMAWEANKLQISKTTQKMHNERKLAFIQAYWILSKYPAIYWDHL